MRRPLLPLIGLLLATGCALGPNYKRPALSVMDTFRGQTPAEAASFADQPWWEVFGDETLKGLITQGLERNYDVRTAVWRVEEYRARAGIERSDWFPHGHVRTGSTLQLRLRRGSDR